MFDLMSSVRKLLGSPKGGTAKSFVSELGRAAKKYFGFRLRKKNTTILIPKPDQNKGVKKPVFQGVKSAESPAAEKTVSSQREKEVALEENNSEDFFDCNDNADLKFLERGQRALLDGRPSIPAEDNAEDSFYDCESINSDYSIDENSTSHFETDEEERFPVEEAVISIQNRKSTPCDLAGW